MATAYRSRLLGGVILTGMLILLANRSSGADATKNEPVVGVLPASPMTAEQLAQHIDKIIKAKLEKAKVTPSSKTSDEDFLRRVYLDLTGRIPSVEQTLAFLESKESNKRAKLIDQLLQSKEFGQHQADIWQALLLPRNSDNRRLLQYFPNFTKWLQEQFNANVGWDKITHEILTATGPVDKTGPATYWLANPTADKATDNVTRMFLGVQLQCAQCHNHPFTDWKQAEYWHMAAFFTRVGPEGNAKRAAKAGGTIQISESPKAARKQRLPASAMKLPPKFLDGEQPKLRSSEPLRPVLAGWMTSPKNPFFAKAMVNRTWGQLFGRGFVHPLDDMHEGNTPSHPDLLKELARQFVATKFDLKYVFRAICNSETYQRSSKPTANNLKAAPELFARMAVKPLTPEQMFDSLVKLVGTSEPRPKNAKGAGGRTNLNPRDAFVAFFGIEDGADPTEYQAGIPQVLMLMNGPRLNKAAFANPIVRSARGKAELIEKLYLTVLSRYPTSTEKERINRFLQDNRDDVRVGVAGVLWAMVNSSEFALNR